MNFKVFLILFPVLSACSNWQINEMSGSAVAVISQGTGIGQIAVNMKDNGVYDNSFSIDVSRGEVIVGDNALKRLQVIDKDKNVKLFIGPKISDKAPPSGVFSFGTIAKSVIDSEGNCFIQNVIRPQSGSSEQGDISSSYILVFNSLGRLQYTIGQKGQADIPFNSIHLMYIDSNGRLIVLENNHEIWKLYRFVGKTRELFNTFGSESFIKKADWEDAKCFIENIIPFESGNEFAMSVSYYKDTRFKYREIVLYDSKDDSIKTLMQLPDPKNELFSILDNKYFLLWDSTSTDIRFSIWDTNGKSISNKRIQSDYFSKDSVLAKIFHDETGNVFTLSVSSSNVIVTEWK